MPTPATTAGDTAWFTHDRFGMFVHWGLYALPARHEWVQSRELIDGARYQRYFEHFDPDLYDPHEWAAAARAAGMKYVVLTAKHHEGFCLWDSQATGYKAPNTPCGRDLLRPFAEAFRAAGLRVGLYYSLIDWHHPHFPIDIYHPLRDRPDAAELNQGRDIGIYAEYMRQQVRELLTGYGPIDIIWFDFSYPERAYRGLPGKGRADWQSERLLALARELQPGIIVDNRLDLPADQADIHTPEQFQPREWLRVNGQPVVWETCQTFSGSWGYHRDEASWKSPEQLIQMLVNSVACGGNLLMNAGPTARGTLDERARGALAAYAEWMRLHSRAIYGCTQSQYAAPPDCRFTQRGSRLYLHIFSWPFRHLHLEGFAGKVAYAQLLNDASEIRLLEPGRHDEWSIAATSANTLTLELPVVKPDVVVPVIELFLNP
ncbi:MAG TPA: alpha-L-fucosidase [Kouleothrix sp.]|uniref:alpha-L-fucosidase n=1 Tax=Kouleothrix sp. TaxID=2779161 RepID=UPI002B7A6AFF|nr:alpha-L-fucosidase [Kouleothrix sp.]HRC77651.1 alpha-L-fucosidase [Kouleothrix sp.]